MVEGDYGAAWFRCPWDLCVLWASVHQQVLEPRPGKEQVYEFCCSSQYELLFRKPCLILHMTEWC